MIIGTAGHIDHGKTALVKALTGIETDRLREEKERGMSIDLGFACIDLPNGGRAGIVDVPGHENLVRNMVAGAHGMDMLLLVVAADDGIMPQTREHLDIIELLGVTRGVVTVTKIDTVDPSRIERVKKELKELLKGRGIESAPVVAVSSATGEGVRELKGLIGELASGGDIGRMHGFFRMPVDRSFSVKGFGTVVTGTVISGKVLTGDVVRLFPAGRELRVRNLESHGVKRGEIGAGERGALNLAGIEKGEIRRGDVLTSVKLSRDTSTFDARVSSASFNGKAIKAGERVHLHTGAADVIATFLPCSAKKLFPGGECFASFSLSRPLQVMRGDRFIIRDYSAQSTLAGGTVLNPFHPKLKRDEKESYFKLWEGGDAATVAGDILKREGGFESIDSIAENLNMAPDDLIPLLERAGGIRVEGDLLILEELFVEIEGEIKGQLDAYHKTSPSGAGIEAETLRQKISDKPLPAIFREVIDRLLKEEVIEKRGEALRLKGRDIRLTPEEAKGRMEIISILKEKGFQTASEAVLAGGDRSKRGYLHAMVKEGEVVQVSKENFIAGGLLDKARTLLLSHFEKKGAITAVEYKNILGIGRKGAILILEHFDSTGLTMRKGDERVLLKRG